jgi:hypothetical protein
VLERRKKVLVKSRDEMSAKISELVLENGSSENSLRVLLREKEELLVQHDLQKLEVKRMRDILHARSDEVFTLENREFQLKKSMEERKREISVHRDVQRAQVKVAEEERHKISVEFSEGEMRVKKLQAKFETVRDTTGRTSCVENAFDRGICWRGYSIDDVYINIYIYI